MQLVSWTGLAYNQHTAGAQLASRRRVKLVLQIVDDKHPRIASRARDLQPPSQPAGASAHSAVNLHLPAPSQAPRDIASPSRHKRGGSQLAHERVENSGKVYFDLLDWTPIHR